MKLEAKSLFGKTPGVSATVLDFVASDSTTTLRERAEIGCLFVNCAVDLSVLASPLGEAADCIVPLEAGSLTEAHSRRILWLSPRSLLIHCPVDEEWPLARRINEAFPEKRAHAALFSDCLCWLELSGPQAFDLLAGGGFVSLDRAGLAVGRVKRTKLAGVAAIVLHEHFQSWLIAVERSQAIYFAEWLRAMAGHSAFIERKPDQSCGGTDEDSASARIRSKGAF
jgi:heterotetrameric sarcosine oxidase gamma subunit